jgi:hypothetical protein
LIIISDLLGPLLGQEMDGTNDFVASVGGDYDAEPEPHRIRPILPP